MYSKIIINLLLIIGLVVAQVALISGLPGWLKSFNLVIVVLVFILGLSDLRLAAWWAIGAGLLMDIYSFLPFGIYTASLLAAAALTYFLLTNFFTNRSLYSFLALIFFAGLCYKIFLYAGSYIIYFISRHDFSLNFGLNFWRNELQQLLINFIAVLLIFYTLNFLSNKFKLAFLVKRK